jgi:putative ABC transport system ATP-binding protein
MLIRASMKFFGDASAMESTRQRALIELQGVGKTFDVPSGRITALCDIDLQINPGERVAIVGRSGSGKTTLVNMLTGIDSPSQGGIDVAGAHLHEMSQEELAVWRGRSVGIVFQFFHLLPTLTVAENVVLPMDFARYGRANDRMRRALDLLGQLGIADQAGKLPADLSGGQQQRAAIARALANDPPLIVADEPTGNLDTATSDQVMTLLAALARQGKTVVAVTHERDLGRFFDRIVSLRDGRGDSDSRRASAIA